MSKRREFTGAVKAAIVHRAMVDGKTFCEGCGVLCKPGEYDIDHTDPDAMQIDKTRKLTVDDGKLLCKAVCHPAKTAKDKADIGKAKRREQKNLGVKKEPSTPIASAGFAPVDKNTRRTTQSAKAASEKLAGLGGSEIMRRYRATP
jgi:hypothetical protein